MTVIGNNEPTATAAAATTPTSTNPFEDDNDETINNLMTTTRKNSLVTDDMTGQAEVASMSNHHHHHRYPNVFYCPITGELMKDPVVCPDGISYERHAIQQQQKMLLPPPQPQDDESNESAATTTSLYYPNRALLSIMEETFQRQQQQQQPNNSFDPSASSSSLLLRLQQNVQSTWNTFVESSQRSITNNNNYNNMDPNASSSSLGGGGAAAVASPNAATMFPPLFEGYHCPITFHLMHDPVIDKEGNSYERVAVENWIRAHGHSPITRTNMSIEELYPNQAIRSLLVEETLKENVHPSILQWKEEPPPNPNDIELGGGILSTMTQNPNNGQNHGQHAQNRPSPATITPTPEEDARDVSRRRMIYNSLVILFGAVCLVGFLWYHSIFFLLLFIMTLTIAFSRSYNARHGNLSEESDG